MVRYFTPSIYALTRQADQRDGKLGLSLAKGTRACILEPYDCSSYLTQGIFEFIMIFRVASLCLALFCSQSAFAEADYSLILVGGGLKSCSSAALDGCVAGTQTPANTLQQQEFQVTPAALGHLNQLFVSPVQRQQLHSLLQFLHARIGQQRLTERALLQALRTAEVEVAGQWMSGREIWQQLSSEQKDALLDVLQTPMLSNGQRLSEQAMPLSLQNKHTLSIYQEIVAQARKVNQRDKPKIVVLTASSRDPFAAVDYYRSLFNSLGAEASWLPISKTYQTIQGEGLAACDQFEERLASVQQTYRRAEIYPDLFSYTQTMCRDGRNFALQLLADADAIFFNGGDQSLTYLSLKQSDGTDTPELAAIRTKFLAKKLVIAGTSAGTAVQTASPHTMITGGDSIGAFASPAYLAPLWSCQPTCPAESTLSGQPTSGFGFFPYGILDTHFSERGRQGRLMQLLAQTQGQLGVGIDENTALLVNPSAKGVQFRVMGEAGVFFAEATDQATRWRTHYLTHDDKASLQPFEQKWQLQFQLAAWKYTNSSRKQMLMQTHDLFDGSRYRALASLLCSNQNSQATGLFEVNGQSWQLLMERTAKTTSRQGALQVQNQMLAVCSYHDLMVSYQEKHE